MFQDVCFTSIQVISQLENCISAPSQSHITHPRLKMCISTQSRSHLNPIQVYRFVSPLHPGSQIHVFFLCLSWILPQSGSWYVHLTYIQVTSHQHSSPPNCILVPSKHNFKPIQVSRCVSHLHPGPFSIGELYLSSYPISPYPRLKMCIATQSRSHLNPIQVL